ncbi:MAG TPA: hypothetical protein VL361_02050 [Candidatus Limnocylindrales bacterium]|jgi:hypothetical protein|nr:hypothetical protein [Candidatus Limnocylindrales bacterium]
MDQNELTGEQKKLVWRYVEVWRRFRRLTNGYRSFAELEDDLAQGSGMFLCGLLVEARSTDVISADVKDPEFHSAIFGNYDSSVSDMTGQELQQARRYIIQGEGEAPVRWWWAKPPFPGHKTRLVADANSSSGSVFLPANNSSAVERAEN